jgi:membrane protein YqaA with SNARE-associated domain
MSDTNTQKPNSFHEIRHARWWQRFGDGKAALPSLFALSFAEAVFFPVPPDVLLAPIAWSKRNPTRKGCFSCIPNLWSWGIATLGSVIGGMLGFAIGMFFFDTVGTWILTTFHLESAFAVVSEQFRDHAFIAVFAAGFTAKHRDCLHGLA